MSSSSPSDKGGDWGAKNWILSLYSKGKTAKVTLHDLHQYVDLNLGEKVLASQVEERMSKLETLNVWPTSPEIRNTNTPKRRKGSKDFDRNKRKVPHKQTVQKNDELTERKSRKLSPEEERIRTIQQRLKLKPFGEKITPKFRKLGRPRKTVAPAMKQNLQNALNNLDSSIPPVARNLFPSEFVNDKMLVVVIPKLDEYVEIQSGRPTSAKKAVEIMRTFEVSREVTPTPRRMGCIIKPIDRQKDSGSPSPSKIPQIKRKRAEEEDTSECETEVSVKEAVEVIKTFEVRREVTPTPRRMGCIIKPIDRQKDSSTPSPRKSLNKRKWDRYRSGASGSEDTEDEDTSECEETMLKTHEVSRKVTPTPPRRMGCIIKPKPIDCRQKDSGSPSPRKMSPSKRKRDGCGCSEEKDAEECETEDVKEQEVIPGWRKRFQLAPEEKLRLLKRFKLDVVVVTAPSKEDLDKNENNEKDAIIPLEKKGNRKTSCPVVQSGHEL